MTMNDYVWIINQHSPYYGDKCQIAGIELEFDGRITGYTLRHRGAFRDVAPTDIEYTTARRRKCSGQMQLF